MVSYLIMRKDEIPMIKSHYTFVKYKQRCPTNENVEEEI